VRGLTGGEGKVRGNVQELTAVSGVAGVEVERGYGGVSTAKPSGRWSSKGGGGVSVAGVLEGGEEAAGKLLRDDVVLLVPLAGAEGLCSGESTARPGDGGA
jgi:hypothetical protein